MCGKTGDMGMLSEADTRPQPVATKKPNPWGLFDMHGNACEWCEDVFLPYSAGAATDPKIQPEGKGPIRVMRGGGFWNVFWMGNRSAHRSSWPEGLASPEGGIRPVRTVPMPR